MVVYTYFLTLDLLLIAPEIEGPQQHFHIHDLPNRQVTERPTEGGLWSFDPDDEVTHFDEPTGVFRIHYSLSGPNQTVLTDTDQSGVPDMVEMVGATAVSALDLYTTDLGFRRPITEADLDLGSLGGSDAYDIYLVDFGGGADGAFGTDACLTAPRHCAGYLVMENDFAGYSYPSLQAAVDTLVSHELFHAVTAAYDADVPVWVSEGTAVWAEHQYDPDSEDFVRLCDAYLADTGRTLYRPPGGPVQALAYGTALWWDFLTAQHGADTIKSLFEAVEPQSQPDLATTMASVLEDLGDPVSHAWPVFARYNLATGMRAGQLGEGHSDAASLRMVDPTDEGLSLAHDLRVYPLASEYLHLQHTGGPLWAGVDPPRPELAFALHPTAGEGLESKLAPALDEFTGDRHPGILAEGQSLAAGSYWLIASYPAIADVSAKTLLCVGDESFVDTCLPAGLPGGSTTDDATNDGQDAESDSTGSTTDSDGFDSAADNTTEGCACTTNFARFPSAWWVVGFFAFTVRRRS